jgi:hypothetical protein
MDNTASASPAQQAPSLAASLHALEKEALHPTNWNVLSSFVDLATRKTAQLIPSPERIHWACQL